MSTNKQKMAINISTTTGRSVCLYLGCELDWLRQGQLRRWWGLHRLLLFGWLLLQLLLLRLWLVLLLLLLLLLVGLLLRSSGVGSVSGVGLLNGGRQELSLSLLEEQLLLSWEESSKLVERGTR